MDLTLCLGAQLDGCEHLPVMGLGPNLGVVDASGAEIRAGA